MNAYFRENLF